uniref:Ig-like domain-containing protein n=1 Tax=Panagrolaimus sp. PS1159 TaxID=55785 RepID=A0AC35G099_9BILA
MAPKPIFVGKPSIRLLKDLKSMILETSFQPQNFIEVKWIFNGERITDNEKYKTRVKAGNATLKINNPTINDSGKYICELKSSKNGSVKQNIQVEVLKDRSKNAPIFIDEPSENWIEDKNGKKLILKFSIQSGTTKAYFSWTKDDEPIKSSGRVLIRTKEESDGKYTASLEIRDPDSDEIGEYLCTVKNDFGQLQAIFNLEGEISPNAPEFTRKPLIIEKEKNGEHVTVFDVAFRTSDEPIITWFDPKNNILSESEDRMKIYLEKDESAENMYTAIFELKNYQESDNGIFTCKIQNKTTKEISLAEIFLNIEF